MSNHIHLIAAAKEGFNLSDILRDMKAHQARQILKSIAEEPESRREWMLSIFKYTALGHDKNEKYQFWTHDNHSIFMDPMRPELFQQRLNYIHQNPVRAGLVANADEYLYSSALNYTGKVGMIAVDVLL
jgi:REP element-mobilizing transposase RayT